MSCLTTRWVVTPMVTGTRQRPRCTIRNGVSVNSGGSLSVDDAEIGYARQGVHSDSLATTVKNTVFRSIRDVAIKLNAAADPAQVSVSH